MIKDMVMAMFPAFPFQLYSVHSNNDVCFLLDIKFYDPIHKLSNKCTEYKFRFKTRRKSPLWWYEDGHPK